MTDAELWDYLQERFGFGEWDEATSDVPWWKFRANEIGKLKRMMRSRSAKPHQLVIAADYATAHAKPVTALWELFALIPEALAEHRRQDAIKRQARWADVVETAIEEAMDAGETQWAERLMRASAAETQTVINEWRNRD